MLQVVAAPAVVQVGTMMIRSPGAAASILLWIESEALTWVGVFPPIVTVTVSIDCLPFPAVMSSCPHCAVDPPYCACCCIAQLGTLLGTVTSIAVSDQLSMTAALPPIVTEDNVLHVVLPAAGLRHCAPKP